MESVLHTLLEWSDVGCAVFALSMQMTVSTCADLQLVLLTKSVRYTYGGGGGGGGERGWGATQLRQQRLLVLSGLFSTPQ